MLIKAVLILLSLSSMLGLGLKIHRGELGSARESASTIGMAFIVNFGLLPVVAVFSSRWLDLSDATLIGLFLCASSPGGASGGLFVLRAGGNPAVGGLLIALLNGANTILTPFLFSFFRGGPAFEWDLFLKLLAIGFFLQGLPLLIGLIGRDYRPKLAARSLPFVERISTLALLLSVILLIFQYGEKAVTLGPPAWIGGFAIIVVSLAVPPFFFWADLSTRASVSVVSGVRSLSLALLLAELHVRQSETLLTILMYGLLMYLSVGIASVLWKNKKSD
ncbi:sodium Bile acid symporter family protein [Leptospira broomii serovar Hurstbridge str. 5399]|uniref:Sodium Bile acid symporter family protein n=1 Tax=Leptospira broomii serovar Hurstbridge str. 5399 TaxID=1049789 RepID=T0FAW9_9LEPT|nr:bile acid:sodium symporter [Leptospira broomii]EQA45021.1 sodium Bile acid symporter family protein [Leptospira broomii serovar Hurstbridge str. 5399]